MTITRELADRIAAQLYPPDWKYSDDGKFKVDNNAGKRAVAVDIANYFLSLKEGCVHNSGIGLCEKCIGEVDKF